ncbi:MAG: hypothetical protein ACHP79_16955, partial [Terriglobales bacterium]
SDAARQWLEKGVERHDANSTEAAHWLCRLLIKAGQADDAARLAAKETAGAQGTFAANLLLDEALEVLGFFERVFGRARA